MVLFIPHFKNVLLIEHVVLHLFSLGIFYEEKRHSDQKKPDCTKADVFMGKKQLFWLNVKAVADGCQRGE